MNAKTIAVFLAFTVGAACAATVTAQTTLSFVGEFDQDDDIELLDFSVSKQSTVVIESLGYAGGVNRAGTTISAGGFDPIVSLFDSERLFLAEADDGREVFDLDTFEALDSRLVLELPAANYLLAVTQYDNYAVGPTVDNGFFREGEGNFTTEFGPGPAFNDYAGNVRTGQWAVDITVPTTPEPHVPEPAAYWLGVFGMALVWCAKRGRLARRPAALARAALVVVAAVVIGSSLAGDARADTSYFASLDATLTIAEFRDVPVDPIPEPDGNPIPKPEELLIAADAFFDPYFETSGEATADAIGSLELIANDPFNLEAGASLEFQGEVSGTTEFPTGSSLAGAFGDSLISLSNLSPEPVTIVFDVTYDYSVNTSVDDPEVEQAFATAFLFVFSDSGFEGEEEFLFEVFALAEFNQSFAGAGTGSFEVTLDAGQSELLYVVSSALGDPPAGTIPEPATSALGVLAAALSGAAKRAISKLRRASGVYDPLE